MDPYCGEIASGVNVAMDVWSLIAPLDNCDE
jgi:hypothetical protein